jgi:hypothetical protein
VASTLSPGSAHASWVGGARGWELGEGQSSVWVAEGRCLSGGAGETRLESVDEPEEGFQRARWGRRGGIHACVGEPGPTRAAICT